MTRANGARLNQLNSGVRVKPFRAQRPPGGWRVWIDAAGQVRRELVDFVAGHVIQMTVDTLYVMRYLRVRFGFGAATQSPVALEQGVIAENQFRVELVAE